MASNFPPGFYGGDPRLDVAQGQGPLGAENPIVRFLRSLRFPQGGMPGTGAGAGMAPPTRQSVGMAPGGAGMRPPSGGVAGMGMGEPPDFATAFGPGAPLASPPSAYAMFGGEAPVIPGPSTKTEPEAPLSFAWGAGEPQPYQPGQTEVLKMRGAPAARGGFMGAAPVAGGTRAGGFGQSQTDWSKVANPMAFEAYTERPAMSAIEAASRDPLFRERGIAEAEMGRDIGVARATVGAQAEARQEAGERMRRETQALADEWVGDENKRRAAQGQPPLSFEEQQNYYAMAQMRFGGAARL